MIVKATDDKEQLKKNSRGTVVVVGGLKKRRATTKKNICKKFRNRHRLTIILFTSLFFLLLRLFFLFNFEYAFLPDFFICSLQFAYLRIIALKKVSWKFYYKLANMTHAWGCMFTYVNYLLLKTWEVQERRKIWKIKICRPDEYVWMALFGQVGNWLIIWVCSYFLSVE